MSLVSAVLKRTACNRFKYSMRGWSDLYLNSVYTLEKYFNCNNV